MAKTKQPKLTAQNLKSQLWDTLLKVQSNKMDAASASSVAMASREIMRVVKTELTISQLVGKAPTMDVIGTENTKQLT